VLSLTIYEDANISIIKMKKHTLQVIRCGGAARCGTHCIADSAVLLKDTMQHCGAWIQFRIAHQAADSHL